MSEELFKNVMKTLCNEGVVEVSLLFYWLDASIRIRDFNIIASL